jgi:N-methylhydantoinase A
MKYVGQTSELTISMPNDSFSNESINNVKEIYMNEHEKTFGYKVDEPMQLVNMRIIARGISSSSRIPDQINIDQKTNQTKDNQRNIYFGKKTGWITAPIIDRLFLNKKPIQQGPIIIEEYDSTTIVPPNWNASLDSMNNIILEKII